MKLEDNSAELASATGLDAASDLELVRTSLGGEPRARKQLVSRLCCVPRIITVLNRRMGNPLSDHDLADLSQDTLVVIWRKLDEFEGRARLETWAYRFCFLELMNMVRSKGRRGRVLGEALDSVGELAESETGVSLLEIEELETGLERLGPPEADVIRLKHYEEKTFKDIGLALEISQNTAKTYYYRGIAWLRRRMAGHSTVDREQGQER